MEKKYVIMADGNMSRWEPGRERPKHLLTVDGETLLARLVRQLHEADPSAAVCITARDPRYEVPGAVRYEPKHNVLEIDRFTWELIEDGVCFLYGDTYYTDQAVRTIASCGAGEDLFFVGGGSAVVAVKVGSAAVMRAHIERVREAYRRGETHECKGWQLYQSYAGLPFGPILRGDHFLQLEDGTQGFNTLEEYESFLRHREA